MKFLYTDATSKDENLGGFVVDKGNIDELVSESGDEADEDSEGYQSNDSNGPISESEKDEPIANMVRRMKGNLYKCQAYGSIILYKGFIFESMEQFRIMLKDLAVKVGFAYRLMKK